MASRTLFVVESDPRTSLRPAEAVRIAAGVGTWKKTEVLLYLRGPAVLALGEFLDDLKDEDNFSRYLPIIGEWGRPVYVEKGAAHLTELGDARLGYEEMDERQLAALAATCQHVLRF